MRKFASRAMAIISADRARSLPAAQGTQTGQDGVGKAAADDFLGRFREIVSDPLNILIERHPAAGCIMDGQLILHNGNRVAPSGRYAYYGKFAEILVVNRGVHEPLEEFVFQELLNVLPEKPFMIELGAYWAHYSMWLKKLRPEATTIMVEPDSANLEVGRYNFSINGFSGEFINNIVREGGFVVDVFVRDRGIDRIDILHSDIQGHEVQMLNGAKETLSKRIVDYALISTHSENLHKAVLDILRNAGYRIEVEADFNLTTTSHDGFVFAVRKEIPVVIEGLLALGRNDILKTNPQSILQYLSEIHRRRLSTTMQN